MKDIQAYIDKAVSLGGKVILPVAEVPNMVTYALVTDIEGNTLGLIKGHQSVPKESKKKPVRKQKKAKKAARTKPKAKKKARR